MATMFEAARLQRLDHADLRQPARAARAQHQRDFLAAADLRGVGAGIMRS